jgi:hypothetical protein
MVKIFSGAFKKKAKTNISINCSQVFSTFLTDVNSYVRKHNSVPSVETALAIRLHNDKLVAMDNSGNEMGYLPSRYNYLVDCIEQGYSYTGKVIASSINPFVSVIIDVTPHEPAE